MPFKRRGWQCATQEVQGDVNNDRALMELAANGWEPFAVHPIVGGWIVFLKREMPEGMARQLRPSDRRN
jgi:hypothetical protein